MKTETDVKRKSVPPVIPNEANYCENTKLAKVGCILGKSIADSTIKKFAQATENDTKNKSHISVEPLTMKPQKQGNRNDQASFKGTDATLNRGLNDEFDQAL